MHHTAEATPFTTAIAFVLDETGSMEVCRGAAIAGFNQWLAEQQRAEGEACTLTLVKFSERPGLPLCRLVHEGAPLAAVPPLNRETYRPNGGTPLLDALGCTIMWMDRQQPPPGRTLVVILTDGEENASHEFTAPQIRDLIRSHEATGTWTFVYLGANQDAWAVSERLGIPDGNTTSFRVQEMGVAFMRASAATARFRQCRGKTSADFWAEDAKS
jgi:hypothetical protein